jgi:CLIP-associating protein 1/2
VLWELVDRYTSQLEGRESDIFAVLLRIRYCNQANVRDDVALSVEEFIDDTFGCAQILAATNTIRDALVHRTDPVFGLTTIHGSLRTFLSEPAPTEASTDAREASLAFGLMALAKFIVRLPAEILEDELPRLKATLIPVRPFHYLPCLKSLIVPRSSPSPFLTRSRPSSCAKPPHL